MKKKLILILITFALFLVGCSTSNNITNKKLNQNFTQPTNVQKAFFQIDGMSCTSCASGVEYQFKQVNGVIDAKVSYKNGTGYVIYDADKVTPETIANASDVYSAKVINK